MTNFAVTASSTVYAVEDATLHNFVTWFRVPNFTTMASSPLYGGGDATMQDVPPRIRDGTFCVQDRTFCIRSVPSWIKYTPSLFWGSSSI